LLLLMLLLIKLALGCTCACACTCAWEAAEADAEPWDKKDNLRVDVEPKYVRSTPESTRTAASSPRLGLGIYARLRCCMEEGL
jgi:hypothetical protein